MNAQFLQERLLNRPTHPQTGEPLTDEQVARYCSVFERILEKARVAEANMPPFDPVTGKRQITLKRADANADLIGFPEWNWDEILQDTR